MTRPLRLEFSGALYHVTARGNARQRIYLDEEDRHLYLDLLGKEITQQGWLCYAYCLMDNHYHLLIETPEPTLVAGMRRLNGVYTQAFNRRHRRAGHLFQGRYQAIVVDKDAYLLELCRYIVLNPVRAKAVKRPERWATTPSLSRQLRDAAMQSVRTVEGDVRVRDVEGGRADAERVPARGSGGPRHPRRHRVPGLRRDRDHDVQVALGVIFYASY